MSRRDTDKPIQVPLTPDQHDALLILRNGQSINQYIRNLIAADAEQRAIDWPDAQRQKWTPPRN